MSIIKVHNRLKDKLTQLEAINNGEKAQFHISVRDSDLKFDCKYIGWKVAKDGSRFKREQPTCSHPEQVKDYCLTRAMILSCRDCPFYSGDK